MKWSWLLPHLFRMHKKWKSLLLVFSITRSVRNVFFLSKDTEFFSAASAGSRNFGPYKHKERRKEKDFSSYGRANQFPYSNFPNEFFVIIYSSAVSLFFFQLNWKKKSTTDTEFRNTPGAVMQSQSLSENNIDTLFSFSLSSASNTLLHLSHVYKFKSIVYIILETQNLFFTYYSIPISIPMPLSRMFSICLCIHSHLLFEVTAEQYSLLGYGYRMDVCARVFLIYIYECVFVAGMEMWIVNVCIICSIG